MKCMWPLLMFVLAAYGQKLSWNFEEGLGGWKPWGTKPEMGDLSTMVGALEDNAHGGKKCLVLNDRTDKGNPYGVVVVAVDPGKTYEWSGWVRSEKPGPAGAHLWVMPVSRTGESDKNLKFAGVGSFDRRVVGTNWQVFHMTLPKLAPETTHVYLAIRPAQIDDPNWQGRFFVDDVVFQSREFKTLNLSATANRGFRDEVVGDGKGGWTDQGDNDLRGMAPGPTNVGGVPFIVLDPTQNQDKSVVVLRPHESPTFLGEVAVPAEGPADFLYLLHTAAWASPGAPVGTLVWQYQDGSSKETPVVGADQVGDWWNGLAKNALAKDFPLANRTRNPVYLFVSAFANPDPGKNLKAVGLKAASAGKAMWMVLSATLGTGLNQVEESRASTRDTSRWQPFAPTLSTAEKPLLDLSFLLDAPAGKHGFVKNVGGKFAYEDKTPARFMAVNIHSASGLLPTHEQAAKVARTLSRYGINLVRLHLMEYVLVDNALADHQSPASADNWDRFDFLVKSLKERGVYVELDSVAGLAARRFSEKGDGVAGGELYFPHRAWGAYHPRLRELGKAWARILLTHTNQYTGKALVDEPAVAMMMLINEQSLFFDWKEASSPTPQAVRDLLTARWNAWLVKKYQNREGLEKAWRTAEGTLPLGAGEDPVKGTVDCWDLYGAILVQNPPASLALARRLETLVAFLKELQRGHYQDFLAFFKALGVKVPMAPSNILYDLADLETGLGLGFTSQNRYYEHMKQIGTAYAFPNIPEVLRDPLTPGELVHPGIAAVKVNTMPVTATEHDTMWPQEWRSTHNLSVYATAALQDWDAIFWYNFMGGYGLTWDEAEKMDGVAYPTVEFNDPALTGLLPAAALMFHRRDVAPAKNLVQVVHDSDLSMQTGRRLQSGGFPWNYLTWVSRVEGVFGRGDGRASYTVGPSGPGSFSFRKEDLLKSPRELGAELDGAMKKNGLLETSRGLQEGRVVSDTGEVTRDFAKGMLTINTGRTAAFSGFPTGPVILGDITIELGVPFATVALQSLENAPLATSKKMFLTAVARAENAKDEVSYGRMVAAPNGGHRGEGLMVTPSSKRGLGSPMRIEPMGALVSIPGGDLRVTAISADGAALTTEVAKSAGGRAVVTLGKAATIWYLVERL